MKATEALTEIRQYVGMQQYDIVNSEEFTRQEAVKLCSVLDGVIKLCWKLTDRIEVQAVKEQEAKEQLGQTSVFDDPFVV